MTIPDVTTMERPVPDPAVPVILGIGLDDSIRHRLTTAVGNFGVVMFTPDVASAHQILRRESEPVQVGDIDDDPSTLTVGDLAIDRPSCRVTWRGAHLALTRQERDLLAALATEPPRVWTYRQLHAAAWDCHFTDPGPVRAAVKRLRRKLQAAGVGVQIVAVRGVGYQLDGAGVRA